jgi:hypothetical protein
MGIFLLFFSLSILHEDVDMLRVNRKEEYNDKNEN